MALLSPKLEEMVLNGEAVVKTDVVGRSGLSVLTVAEDRTIIIIEFDYQNFTDVIDRDDLDGYLERSVHQLSFKSAKSQNHFVVRDELNSLMVGVMPQDARQNVNGYYQKECFLVHTGNVTVQIVASVQTDGVISVSGVAPAKLGTEQPPLGYGSGILAFPQTVNESDAAGDTQYNPLTKRFNEFTLATPFNVSQLLYPVSPQTILNPTLNDPLGQRTYPIVNITYLEILREVATKLFTTS